MASRAGSGGPGTGGDGKAALPGQATLRPFPGARTYAGEGVWQPAGRLVGGKPAVYETLLVPPGDSKRGGIAWMDTRLLSARLYSGSMSPGGGPYKYTAPVTRTAASSLVAAFNGGFKMADAHGGYYTEGRTIKPLARGGASLVIYANGSITVGAWGSDVTMTLSVWPSGKPVPAGRRRQAQRAAATSTLAGMGRHLLLRERPARLGVPVAVRRWASPLTAPWSTWSARYSARSRLADLLARAGRCAGCNWTSTRPGRYSPASSPPAPDGLAAPSNGARLVDTYRGPATFFDPLRPECQDRAWHSGQLLFRRARRGAR